MAERIAQNPDWVNVSEDDYWVRVKEGRAAGELRTREEEQVVQAQVVRQIAKLVQTNKHIVLEFILYEDPPHPLLNYQTAFNALGVSFATRILRAPVNEVLRRMAHRSRPSDADAEARRAPVEHQIRCLASRHLENHWIVDTSDFGLEEVYARYFKAIVDGDSG
jgi:hypothetical protein